MRYGLGIDTGGTYTDGVIYDFESKKVKASAKTLTIKENLNRCISNLMDMLPQEELSTVELVSLSTTLATNACVEGRGARAAAIFIGCDPRTVEKYGSRYGLASAEAMIFLEGGHNQQGDVIREPDWDELRDQLDIHCMKVDCFAITQMWGVRNPEFEIKARSIVREFTGKPAICSHELAGELNFLKRAATGLLNAQLIPLVNSFMDAVKATLAQRGITCPVMIVRGDGSLMSESFARERPVETLLSGPAASVSGGVHLSGRKNCIIVDIGGTTSDIAIIRQGVPQLSSEGVRVGNWILGTGAINMHTAGLGGDSRIAFHSREGLTVGPVRVAPISWLAAENPEIMKELAVLEEKYLKHSRWLLEFFYLLKDITDDSSYTDQEKAMAQALSAGPLSTPALAEAISSSVYELKTEKLEKHGIIMRSGLTPTDIMHLTGSYSRWNSSAAEICARALAFRLGLPLSKLPDAVWDKIRRELYFLIAEALLNYEGGSIQELQKNNVAQELLMMGYKSKSSERKDSSSITINLNTELELVGIGAPAHVFLDGLAASFNTGCTIPEYAEVANALGAVTGNVLVEEAVIIQPGFTSSGIDGYYCYSSRGRARFELYEEACSWAQSEAADIAEKAAYARGAAEVQVTVETESTTYALPADYVTAPDYKDDEKAVSAGTSDEDKPEPDVSNQVLLETRVLARAQGPVGREVSP